MVVEHKFPEGERRFIRDAKVVVQRVIDGTAVDLPSLGELKRF